MKSLFLILLCSFFSASIAQSKLVFEDQFDGAVLNEKYWNYELGDGCPNLCGWGNNERQIYTKKNVRLANGHLIISATKTGDVYESGRITTKAKVEMLYGTIEVRAKLAIGKGVWPAVWMLGSAIDELKWPMCGEIDIMEYVGKEPQRVFTSLHTAASYGNTTNTKKTKIDAIEDGFHLYRAHWTADSISFYIDDALVYTFAPDVKNDKTWPFDKPFYALINLAVGGNFGGPEVDDSIFPQELIVDYIKIFKK
jgi:beta-glucanase (GH16 family)